MQVDYRLHVRVLTGVWACMGPRVLEAPLTSNHVSVSELLKPKGTCHRAAGKVKRQKLEWKTPQREVCIVGSECMDLAGVDIEGIRLKTLFLGTGSP